LLEFLAHASGWKDWMISDSIQTLAASLLPWLKEMQGGIRAPLERASNEILAFLQDLLGEQAAAVILSVGGRAIASGSRAPGSRTRTGHNRADVHPKGQELPRQKPDKVKNDSATREKPGAGRISTVMHRTRQVFADMASNVKGMMGEHMVDYHELKRLKGTWPHDQTSGTYNPVSVRKLNRNQQPVHLDPIKINLADITRPGIDAVWGHNGQYTVTEAKTSINLFAVEGGGKLKEKHGNIPTVQMADKTLHYLLGSSKGAAGGHPMTQMSWEWVKDRCQREGISSQAQQALRAQKAIRRVVLVTLDGRVRRNMRKRLPPCCRLRVPTCPHI
jgi:hypothetical protein